MNQDNYNDMGFSLLVQIDIPEKNSIGALGKC